MGDEWVMSYVNMGGTLYSSMTDFEKPLGWRQAYLRLGCSYCEMYQYLTLDSTRCFVEIGDHAGEVNHVR